MTLLSHSLTGGPVANAFAIRRDPLGFLQRLTKEHGSVAFFEWGAQRTWLMNHPDLVKEVLVTQDRHFSKWFAVERTKSLLGNGLFVSEGDYHRRQRKLAQPSFHSQRIQEYGRVMLQTATTVQGRWKSGETVDIAKEMNWLALVIVAKTLFGADVDTEAGEIRTALSEILDQFGRATLPSDEQEHFERSRARLDETVLRLIAERRASGEDKGDLLSMLLNAHDEVDGSTLDDRQIKDEAMTIFLAGHETSATALTWTWYLLATHPEVEQRLQAELEEVIGKREAATEDATRLPYASMIFNEALRLYPPVWAIGRKALRPLQIGTTDLQEGDVVILSPYVTHRDRRFYKDPDHFLPERWTPEARAERPKFAYFPFSAGSRSCLGEPFAWMESLLTIATISRRWRMEVEPGQSIELQPQLTLRPKSGMRMRVWPKS